MRSSLNRLLDEAAASERGARRSSRRSGDDSVGRGDENGKKEKERE